MGGMKIVILGAGSVGCHLAGMLSQEGHDVIVIDCDPKALDRIARTADVATRLGSGTDAQLLEDLLEHNPYFFIAVSSNDETNLIACSIAKNLGYPKTIARIRQRGYLQRGRLDFSRLFFVDYFIGTELLVAHDIAKEILHPGNRTVETFAHGTVQMRTITIPPSWRYGEKKIAELSLPHNLLVGLIHRKLDNKIIFPHGDDAIFSEDEVTLIGETKIMLRLQEIFGVAHPHVKSVVIVGGSSIALHTCQLLQEQNVHVKIVEADAAKCRQLAEQLPHTTILNHEMTDMEFFRAEKIDSADAIVTCTSSHETNILVAALAKQIGCERVIPLVSEESYIPLLLRLGIFRTVSERTSIAEKIHAIINSNAILSITSLFDNRANIMEIKISTDSQIVGIPIADLSSRLPQDFLFALIENKGRILIPKGNHILSPGDTVIVICNPTHVPELEKIF